MISVGWRGLNGEPARFNEAERCGRAGEFTPLPAQRHRRYGKWKFNLQIDPRPNRSARQYVQQALIRADFHPFVYIETPPLPFYSYLPHIPYCVSSLPLPRSRSSFESEWRSCFAVAISEAAGKRNFSSPRNPVGNFVKQFSMVDWSQW